MNKNPIQFARSKEFFASSQSYLAGGVSSSMRASAKPLPLFFSAGFGPYLTDVDGNRYIDYALAWGPLILGHSHPAILSAVDTQMQKCQVLGAQNELEIQVAKKICEMVPCAEQVVFNNTGSEAVQVAFRLARAFTGKRKIIRFEGHYHGWLDNVLIGYRPSVNSDGILKLPTEGMDPNAAHETLTLKWNDVQEVETTLQKHGDDIAAIIAEPILCNCLCLLPAPEYLEQLRTLATRYGVVLIFDEVITGFRVAPGGAQSLFNVTPDLATFGKAVAGGFPLSVVAGKQKIMELIAHGRVMHAGTFNGNPISLAAANATLNVLSGSNGTVMNRISRTGTALMEGINHLAEEFEISILINGVGASFNVAFTTRRQMRNFRDTLDSNTAARDVFVEAMLACGIYLMPDGRWYVSAAHSQQDVELTLEAVRKVFSTYNEELIAQPQKTGMAAETRSN